MLDASDWSVADSATGLAAPLNCPSIFQIRHAVEGIAFPPIQGEINQITFDSSFQVFLSWHALMSVTMHRDEAMASR
jgi:hypothetical protein